MVILLAKEHQRRIKRKLQARPDKLAELKAILFDFELFCFRMLKIKNKQGKVVSLELNDAQRRYAQRVFHDIASGKPVRIIILKARQMGFSTVTEAIIYYFSSLQEAKNAFIVAQSSDASSNLYDMFQFYYERVPAMIQPMSRKNNARKLTFENPAIRTADRRRNPGLKSKITVQTAESRVLARSDTIHYLHASEVAFWPAKKRSGICYRSWLLYLKSRAALALLSPRQTAWKSLSSYGIQPLRARVILLRSFLYGLKCRTIDNLSRRALK